MRAVAGDGMAAEVPPLWESAMGDVTLAVVDRDGGTRVLARWPATRARRAIADAGYRMRAAGGDVAAAELRDGSEAFLDGETTEGAIALCELAESALAIGGAGAVVSVRRAA